MSWSGVKNDFFGFGLNKSRYCISYTLSSLYVNGSLNKLKSCSFGLNKSHFMKQMTTFHFCLVNTIHSVMLLPTIYVLTINEIFQMRYCKKFYLKGHQNYNMTKSKISRKCPFIQYIQRCKSILGAHC